MDGKCFFQPWFVESIMPKAECRIKVICKFSSVWEWRVAPLTPSLFKGQLYSALDTKTNSSPSTQNLLQPPLAHVMTILFSSSSDQKHGNNLWSLFFLFLILCPSENSVGFAFKIYLESEHFLPSPLLQPWLKPALFFTWITAMASIRFPCFYFCTPVAYSQHRSQMIISKHNQSRSLLCVEPCTCSQFCSAWKLKS